FPPRRNSGSEGTDAPRSDQLRFALDQLGFEFAGDQRMALQVIVILAKPDAMAGVQEADGVEGLGDRRAGEMLSLRAVDAPVAQDGLALALQVVLKMPHPGRGCRIELAVDLDVRTGRPLPDLGRV